MLVATEVQAANGYNSTPKEVADGIDKHIKLLLEVRDGLTIAQSIAILDIISILNGLAADARTGEYSLTLEAGR